jgi:hypothetical protein
MTNDGNLPPRPRPTRRGLTLVASLVLIAIFLSFALAAAAPKTLQVEASASLPGFHRADLPRYLALHMANARLADWRFEAAAGEVSAPDRVEWNFRVNPYAGGEVRSFGRLHLPARTFGIHRPITIEARLYLNGKFQTLVEKQAVVQGGPGDPDLAAAVASVTQNLLGPEGAYRAIDSGQGPIYRPR